ncbi:MAG: hypothetical protein ACYDA8_02040 [Deferrisomatales bacterium]
MRGKREWRVLGWVVAACVLFAACSGARPIQKGDTVRCPSCGAEYKVEEGMRHGK